MPANPNRKLRWFRRGAASYAQYLGALPAVPSYPCPLCLTIFSQEAVAERRLTAEHVPPQSVGGKEFLLTCGPCNSKSGHTIDADLANKHKADSMFSRSGRPGRVVVRYKAARVTGHIDVSSGKITVPFDTNRPGTRELVVGLKAGTKLTVETRTRYAELGVNISYLKAGYLALVGHFGYTIAFDPAMELIRKQIAEPDKALMATFGLAENGPDPASPSGSPVLRIFRVWTPVAFQGWKVQVGRFTVSYPYSGDVSFYDRLAIVAGRPVQTSCEFVAAPEAATFGLTEAQLELLHKDTSPAHSRDR